MLKRKFAAAASVLLAAAVSLSACKGTHDELPTLDGSDEETDVSIPSSSEISWLPDVDIHNFIMPEEGEKIAVITVKDYGEIKIKLFPEDAPKGVENFTGLAEMNYYDELIFHRVIPNFMIQGGDPKGNGTGGKSLWGDKFEGGTSENLYHFTGAVAYANSSGTSTNGSQFYIVNTPDDFVYYGAYRDMDNTIKYFQSFEEAGIVLPKNVAEKYGEVGGVPFLDGGYTVFGQVFEGIDVVRAIAEVETDQDPDSPTVDKPLKQVLMESVRIEEYHS